MKKLTLYFVALVAMLLLGSAVTFGAGISGLQSLNTSFDSVVKQDVSRLISITDIRRRIRSRLLLERDLLLTKDHEKAKAMTKDFLKAEKGLNEEAAHYEQFLVQDDAVSWAALRENIKAQTDLNHQVQGAFLGGQAEEAARLSASHDPRWEGLIKDLIAVAQARLDAKSKEAAELYQASLRIVWAAFLLSALLGLVAGTIIYLGIKRMVSEVVALKDQLMTANASLEQTVEERTRTIRAILDHVQFGFFLAGPDLRITEGYTRSLSTLLHREDLTGLLVSEALGLSHAKGQELALFLDQCFEDVFPDDVACGQIPSRFTLHGRILNLQASIVRDASGNISQLLFGLSDVTELEAAEKSTREAQVLLRALKSPESFRLFVTDLNQRFDATREAVQSSNEPRARRELHTIKGNAGCYGLTDIAQQAHQIEEQSEIPLPMIVDLEHAFEQFLSSHAEVLGLDVEGRGREVFRLNEPQLAELESLVARSSDLEALRGSLGSRLERLRWRQAEEFTGPFYTLVSSLAERLGKDVQLKVAGGDTMLLPSRVTPLLAVLPHMLRNALDHGFEARGERGDKPEMGTLTLTFEEAPSAWTLTVSDDGRGINTEQLRQKAIDRGLLRKDERLSEDQLAQLIFLPSLSTASEVTDISGRGEGMAAVSEAIKNIGGQLSVRTALGKGTSIVIYLPKRAGRLAA